MTENPSRVSARFVVSRGCKMNGIQAQGSLVTEQFEWGAKWREGGRLLPTNPKMTEMTWLRCGDDFGRCTKSIVENIGQRTLEDAMPWHHMATCDGIRSPNVLKVISQQRNGSMPAREGMALKIVVLVALCLFALFLISSTTTAAEVEKEVQESSAVEQGHEEAYGGCKYGCCYKGRYGCKRCCSYEGEVVDGEEKAFGRCKYGCCHKGHFHCRRCCRNLGEAEEEANAAQP
eukprot:Gb_24511 [translate_table: standard]